MRNNDQPGIGHIDQICYVTDDIEAAVAKWHREWGAGPFFMLAGVKFPEWTYLGEPQDLPMDLVVGQLGPMQIEFIRPHSDKPSAYSHAMTGGCVLHHYGVVVDDLKEAEARLGNPVALATATSAGGTPFSYVDCRKEYGMVIEMIEGREDVLGIFSLVREAAKGWDGNDLLRPMPGAEVTP
ncbi:hypothetical protein GCM10011371_21110 [Novosphingobium marinum]|uniref:VOC family protein n=1 Tax=Novosphingobium marinum TaxID=1514948 RepID=A0A7Y9Y034_9SPHN|nr:VOC family protein [Novosphingobium marinum]NYH96223.1 hypothetical protein [Novosphingobium marinum]GGC33464.1 hypothetical protein GCM10011371_21110 [Novosphingobium marinum]